MRAWAKATIAKPIAATINAKPILYFIGEPSSKSYRKPYAILASEICDGHHKKSLFYPNQARSEPKRAACDDPGSPRRPISAFLGTTTRKSMFKIGMFAEFERSIIHGILG